MYSNDFTGQIPTEIGMLKDCKAFLLNDNKLGGTLPQQMGLMADLRWFHLSGNKVGGSIPDLILTLKDLTELKLGHNALTGMCVWLSTVKTNLFSFDNTLTQSILPSLDSIRQDSKRHC
jgi:hypothetical protein